MRKYHGYQPICAEKDLPRVILGAIRKPCLPTGGTKRTTRGAGPD